jgi:hypothetical protein
MDTGAGLETFVPSLTVNVKPSLPSKPGSGV